MNEAAPRPRMVTVVLQLLIIAVATLAQEPTPAVPRDPVEAILEAFESYPVLALSDAHGNEQAHAFRLALIRDPRFPLTVDDIVVELGNARYQSVVDRFVQGDDVPLETLRLAWRDTTQTTAANNYAMMRELIETVRDVNASLASEQRLRVLLGDPPIDWDTVHTTEDHWKWIEMRDTYPAALIQVEVLAKQRRALLMYGHMHFQRRNLFSNYVMQHWQAQSIVSLLERTTPTRVFTIWQHDLARVPVDVSSWPVPSIATIKGTTLGTVDFTLYYPAPAQRFTIRDGAREPIPPEQWQSLRAEEQLDAVLYLGPATSTRRAYEIPPALCAEPGFLETQLARIAISGVPAFEGERLRRYCADAVAR